MLKRQLALLLAALTLALCLTGCGGTGTPVPAEKDALTLLRQEIAASGSLCGAAYLGTMPQGGDVLEWLADNGWTQTFPFLANMTAQQVVTQDGGEVYCIVPADENARMTVQAYDALNEASPFGDILYDSLDGAPICLRGNVSDIMSNLAVTVASEESETVYRPALSLRDGTLNTAADKGSVYDFTPGAAHALAPIRELYSEEFDYTDGVGNAGHYTYRVPQLLADTDGAADINRDIESRYAPIVREALESQAAGVSLPCLYIAWETYQYGDILSLLVSCGWDFDMNEYSVYLYDTGSGARLTTAELLTALDIDETAFLDAVRQAAAERFDGKYTAVDGSMQEALAERREWTLSDENVNLDTMAFVDGSGQLHVVLPIGSIAGADAYEEWLTPGIRAAG